MKILTANIALGLENMDHLLPIIRGHLAFHGSTMVNFLFHPKSLKKAQARPSRRRTEYLFGHVNLQNTLKLVERTGADIVVLNEVLPQFHFAQLEPHLEELGYRTRVWGESMHYPDATVSTLIASKMPGSVVPIDLSWEEHAGGGAGVAAVRFDDSAITAIGLHLGIADKFPWLYEAEISALAKFIAEEQAAGREVIAAGDWNASAAFIQRHRSFSKLGLADAAGDIPTCPTFLPWQKPLDHVFVPKSWSVLDRQACAFGSDHLALIVNVADTRDAVL